MNRLELCRRLRREVGLASNNDNGPSSTLSQSGEMLNIVNWIDAAWRELQGMRLWTWMWESATVTVLATTNVTAGTIPARRYIKDEVWQGTSLMNYLPWEQFRVTYPTAQIVAGTPTVWTIRPDKAFVVNAKPAANADFTLERFKNPTDMALDADIPALESEFHMVIVWRAAMKYAGFDEAGSVYQNAKAQHDFLMSGMGLNDLPDIEFGAALC